MGNSHNKTNQNRNLKPLNSNREGQTYTSQFSISHFVGNLSGRSFLSATSNQSVYSTSRPWSRISRRRWHDTTLTNPLDASKTAWPVAHQESIFLPEFPIRTDLIQREFDVKEVIAKGAFGEVCRVTKTSENKDFALKVLSKAQVVSENAVRQLKDEARIQELCGHHSFIVGSVAKWQTKKRLYIVSEYIPGGELLALLDKYGKLPEELVKIFIAQIAIALDFLHNAGVIYRDLKPENILLDPQCHVQLIDFGLSKWLTIGARTTTLCGTLKYMAPEVLSRDPYGHAVDWWSLGVIACRMLLDEYPTPAATSSRPRTRSPCSASTSTAIEGNPDDEESLDECIEVIQKPPGTLPACADELSSGARGLLLRLLDKDPRVRLRSLRQLQQTAFFMGYNFDHVKVKKISPRSILEKHFPNGPIAAPAQYIPQQEQMFSHFEQITLI